MVILTVDQLCNYLRIYENLNSETQRITFFQVIHNRERGPDLLYNIEEFDQNVGKIVSKEFIFSQCNFPCQCCTVKELGLTYEWCLKCKQIFHRRRYLHRPCYSFPKMESCLPVKSITLSSHVVENAPNE